MDDIERSEPGDPIVKTITDRLYPEHCPHDRPREQCQTCENDALRQQLQGAVEALGAIRSQAEQPGLSASDAVEAIIGVLDRYDMARGRR